VYLFLALLLAFGPLGCTGLMNAKANSDERIEQLSDIVNDLEHKASEGGLDDLQLRRYQTLLAEAKTALEKEIDRNKEISAQIQNEYQSWSGMAGKVLGGILGTGSLVGLLATDRRTQ
jgi:hypothetical protein